jgi:DedD protein
MHRGFGGTAFEPVEEPRDRELTLGPSMLVGLICGLLAICAACFVFGYAVGRRSSTEFESPGVRPVAGATVPAVSAQSKPSATQGGFQRQQPAVADVSTAAAADAAAPTEPVQSSSPSTPAASTPAIQSALPQQSTAPLPVPGGGGKVETALPQTSTLMVQIAAVSHPEDAEVLVGALRKRGYPVTARRDPTDGLLHVQIGPFANRNDANTMRQKLLNDGYNAIVQ